MASLGLLALFASIGLALAAHPDAFCKICKCANSPKGGTVDVHCDNVDVKAHLYDHGFWYDDKNQTLDINSLDLRYNYIRVLKTQFLPSKLTLLDLSNNGIETIGPSVFAQLQDMETLILSHNLLSYLDPEAFRGLVLDSADYPLRSLTTLRLDNNQFHTFDKDIFQHLNRIESFSAAYNPFKVIDHPTMVMFGDLYSLKELDFSYMQLSDLPDNLLHTPKYLKLLNLSGNLFEKVPATLGDSHSLEVLYFDDNLVVNLTKANGFPKVPTLKTLTMCRMPLLRTIGEGALSGLENLQELHVTDNIELREVHPAALSRREEGAAENELWPPLKKIRLENNKLTNLDMHLYVRWQGLSELNLLDNPWTCECENQWMLDELMPAYKKINLTMAKRLVCAAPIEMAGKTFYDLHESKTNMRCLDKYGNQPEKDAALLVGILAGLLIGIPLVLFAMYAYQRRCFGYFDNSPAAYSRRFYSRTHSDDL